MQRPPPDESRMSTSGVLVRVATARFLPDLMQNSPHSDPAIDFPLLWRSFKRRKDLETDELEAMWLELRPMNQKFFLYVVYRPPNSALCFWDDLQKSIETIQSNYNSTVMLIGDLNADFRTRPGKALLNSVERNNLRIHNREPTRITDHSATVIDQCISSFF